MAILYKNVRANAVNLLPLIVLYYLSISEIDTQFSNMFEILSFNLQIIIVYYWTLRSTHIIGNGHIFFAGIINDVVMGLPLGISAISYLTVAFTASYVRQVTVNISLFTDWFTFLLAIFFSNLVYLTLILNFANYQISFLDVSYNAFFTFLFYPFIWAIFNFYKKIMVIRSDD